MLSHAALDVERHLAHGRGVSGPRLVTCTQIDVDDDAPLPDAFQIFAAGSNESTKGPAIFDAEAASSVMSTFAQQGVDCMIDLEHAAIDPHTRALRADAGDAMGWCSLEVRDGALWAVDVRWTPEGERRLRARSQRYISPAFFVDEAGRVVELVNIALVSMPATYHAAPLVAASRVALRGALALCTASLVTRGDSMDPEKIKAALEAIKAGDAEAALGLLEEMIAEAVAGPMPDDGEGEGAPSDGEALAETPDEEDMSAAARVLRRLTGRSSVSEAEQELIALRSRVDAIEAERRQLDEEARRELVGDLVRLGVELPATAWADAERRVPVARLTQEPLAELRARVALLRKARPQGAQGHVPAPRDHVELSAIEQRHADAIQDPAARERYIALRRARRQA